MKTEKIIAGVFAAVLGGMAFKVFNTILKKEEVEVAEDEIWIAKTIKRQS